MTDEEYERLAERTIRDLGERSIKVTPDGRVSAHDAAELVGRSYSRLKAWRVEGTGPRWFDVGGRVHYSIDDLLRWIYYGEHAS
ncbi:hypothetical protein RM530_05650 [Algiphilus sp. W345]|uniref:Helix-turn-helix domain-containing protein n=1 Tax=Banduia mediterranea TaxID=3075609 RepID=A0ABU2WG57_9GAMM|nr:hypothetical protein [Algiphilus sp. W345]MDT0496847.1 hypothetical protein [Algiphilus sp. W345]